MRSDGSQGHGVLGVRCGRKRSWGRTLSHRPGHKLRDAPRSSLMILAELVKAHAITTLMVTHGVDHALAVGGRLSILHGGRLPADLSGEEKTRLTLQNVVDLFRGVLSVSFA